MWIPTKDSHAFQFEAGHLFRPEAGRRSDLMSAAGGLIPQIEVDEFRLSGLVKTALISRRRTLLSQNFAGETDPIGVVDHPIEDRVDEWRLLDYAVRPSLLKSCSPSSLNVQMKTAVRMIVKARSSDVISGWAAIYMYRWRNNCNRNNDSRRGRERWVESYVLTFFRGSDFNHRGVECLCNRQRGGQQADSNRRQTGYEPRHTTPSAQRLPVFR